MKTQISFYITLDYAAQKKYKENFALCQHTTTEIENCLDFIEKNLLSKYETAINIVTHLQKKMLPEVLRSKAIAHSKILQ